MRIPTAVIGAGPAGLLFCVLARLLDARRPTADKPLWLFDKRDTYERTHRLRMDPAAWRAIADAVPDPRFEPILTFLEAERWRPAVNDLETCLAEVAAQLGVTRQRLVFGDVDLPALRQHLGLRSDEAFALVGADSVHSTVREMFRGNAPAHEQTHQHLARLRVDGTQLPPTLGWVERYKMSKVLASLLDWRLDPDGHGALDLFLTADEHRAVVALGATPRDPVRLDPARLSALDAPFFRRIVERAADGFGRGPCEVVLLSTFRLEHRYVERVAYEVPGARVFLVGDAALSLPFFRGTASLARCALALARALDEDPDGAVARYDTEVASIREREIRVVASRAWLVRGAREFVRISSLLPFPMQTWLLSDADRDARPDTPGLGLLANLAVAVPVLLLALAAPLAALHADPRWLWLWILAIPLEGLGGWLYAAARAFEGGPGRYVRAVWRWQIALLLVAGGAIAMTAPLSLATAVAALSWFVLAAPFVAGLYAFESFDRRWWDEAFG